jgi:hypothetical protein
VDGLVSDDVRTARRERFQALVARAIERADREHAEHLAAIRAGRSVPGRGIRRNKVSDAEVSE